MKNTTIIIGVIIMIALASAFVYSNSGSTNNKDTETTTSNGEIQKVVLSYKNGNYYPQTVTVKSGQPVEISLDSSVQGCYRSFTISALNVRKYLGSPSDSVTFTPTQKGTYRFACSMGMGTGTLIVE